MNVKASALCLLLAVFTGTPVMADDAETNKTAKKIKSKVEKKIKKHKSPLDGFCDLMIEMRHKNKYAYIVRVRTSGDAKLCKVAKSALKKGDRFRYQTAEKHIRIHVTE